MLRSLSTSRSNEEAEGEMIEFESHGLPSEEATSESWAMLRAFMHLPFLSTLHVCASFVNSAE
jgi:hypothetical protein